MKYNIAPTPMKIENEIIAATPALEELAAMLVRMNAPEPLTMPAMMPTTVKLNEWPVA